MAKGQKAPTGQPKSPRPTAATAGGAPYPEQTARPKVYAQVDNTPNPVRPTKAAGPRPDYVKPPANVAPQNPPQAR